jgi:hypothetical protein
MECEEHLISKENDMDTERKATRRELRLLELLGNLGNVKAAR